MFNSVYFVKDKNYELQRLKDLENPVKIDNYSIKIGRDTDEFARVIVGYFSNVGKLANAGQSRGIFETLLLQAFPNFTDTVMAKLVNACVQGSTKNPATNYSER